MRRAALALAAGFAAHPALAQQAPLMIATRDVAVTYRASSPGAPDATIGMAWLAARQALRMEAPGVGYSVTDHAAGSGFIVIEGERRVMPMPPQLVGRQLGPSPAARFTREGSERVAGHGCTVWRYQDAQGEGRLCMTEDGVMLRSAATMSGISGQMEAIRVEYAAQDPARFVMPEGFQLVQPRQPRR